MTFDRVEERYQRDNDFKTLVDVIEVCIEKMRLSPTEAREAAMLAVYKFECRRPKEVVFGVDWGISNAITAVMERLPDGTYRRIR